MNCALSSYAPAILRLHEASPVPSCSKLHAVVTQARAVNARRLRSGEVSIDGGSNLSKHVSGCFGEDLEETLRGVLLRVCHREKAGSQVQLSVHPMPLTFE